MTDRAAVEAAAATLAEVLTRARRRKAGGDGSWAALSRDVHELSREGWPGRPPLTQRADYEDEIARLSALARGDTDASRWAHGDAWLQTEVSRLAELAETLRPKKAIAPSGATSRTSDHDPARRWPRIT